MEIFGFKVYASKLLSIGSFYTLIFSQKRCHIRNLHGETIATVYRSSNLVKKSLRPKLKVMKATNTKNTRGRLEFLENVIADPFRLPGFSKFCLAPRMTNKERPAH